MEGKLYLAQIISTIEYLHSIGYMHRDIKSLNILFDNNGNTRLADFGFAVKISKRASHLGTKEYTGLNNYLNKTICKLQKCLKRKAIATKLICGHWEF